MPACRLLLVFLCVALFALFALVVERSADERRVCVLCLLCERHHLLLMDVRASARIAMCVCVCASHIHHSNHSN